MAEITKRERSQIQRRLAANLATFRRQMAGVTEAEVLEALREPDPVVNGGKRSAQAESVPVDKPRASASTRTHSQPG